MTSNQPITFIIPCRNNLKYLQQAVQSIENYYGEYHHIVILSMPNPNIYPKHTDASQEKASTPSREPCSD